MRPESRSFARNLETSHALSSGRIDFILKRRTTRRTVALKITPDGQVVVLAPHTVGDQAILRFVQEHHSWIDERLRHITERLDSIPRRRYETGETLPYLGRSYSISLGNQRDIALDNNSIRLPDVSIDRRYTALIRWYKTRALDIFSDRILLYQSRVGHPPSDIKLSTARTRWGACTSRGVVSLRWTLIMAPITVIDYVVIHELCHLVHMNHSRAFWKLVKSICPDFKVAVEWLRMYGHQLDLLRPED